MRISLNWIKEFVEIGAPAQEVADALTMAGLEVEGVFPRYSDLDRVVVASIEEILPHPKADKLRICRVDAGGETFDVVCGAPNIAVGQRVPLALKGAVLPSGVRIRKAKIRGVESVGMICSEAELGLTEEASGIMVLEPDAPPGTPLKEVLHLDDFILEISLTPNRPDCMNAVGIAREVAALFGTTLRYPEASVPEAGAPISGQTSVTLEDPEGCPRYAARLVRNVRIGPSPYWLRERLHSTGLRSINNIVDITNYVLMELGQPLHAFDLDRLAEHRIVVRRAQAGERFITLDGVERELPPEALMICDGEKAVALAGIMGGLNSEITETTRHVLIESAYFDPVTIRRTSKALNLTTEASYRFERGVDPEGVLRAVDRAARLMVQLAGGEAARGRIDEYPSPVRSRTISFRVNKANEYLGTRLSSGEMKRCFTALEFDVREETPDRFQVTCPTFRRDLEREVDLIEEVARMHGYNAIPVTYPPATQPAPPRNEGLAARLRAVEILRSAGFTEVVNYSFVSPAWLETCGLSPEHSGNGAIRILNPLSEEQSVMRTHLLPGLLATVQRNAAFRNTNLKLFELAKVYRSGEGKSPAREPFYLAGIHTGLREPFSWCRRNETVDFFDVKGAVILVLQEFRIPDPTFVPEKEHPVFAKGESARLLVENEQVGSLGRISDRVLQGFDIPFPVYAFELDFDVLLRFQQKEVRVRPLPRFPAVIRDLAIVVRKEVLSDRIGRLIREFVPSDLLDSFSLFDVYRGEQIGRDEVSLAYRIVYRAADRTLSDDEVNRIHETLIQAVLRATDGRLREST